MATALVWRTTPPPKTINSRSAAADVQQAAAEIALVLREASFRGGQRLEDRIADEDAALFAAGDKICVAATEEVTK